jgi:hypothetical protein
VALVAALTLCAGAPAAAPADATLDVTVSGTDTGQPIAPAFIGTSIEFPAIHQYTGRDPTNVNPVLVALLRNLSPGDAPVIRIGGNSTDRTWWPVPGVLPPSGVTYALTNGWLRTTRALAADLGAKLIVGVNLAAGRPAIATAEEQAYLRGIGRKYIEAFEIGNEPDLYGNFAWYKGPDGQVLFPRGRTYGLTAFTHDFNRWRAALGDVPLAGPALAELAWAAQLDTFINEEPGLQIVTMHRYPLRGCVTDPSSPIFASISNLLADSSSSGVAQSIASFVTAAHDHNLPFRLDELNSVACSGIKGVSNTFASALWALDTLFDLASVGVDGVNFHTLPKSGYELATYSDSHGVWKAFVHPEYYAMLMFDQAAPPGSHLLGVDAPAGPLKVWATRSSSGQVHVVLINKSTTAAQSVQLTLPRSTTVSVEQLTAPSASATSGVTLGTRTFGTSTTTGTLPGPMVTTPLSSFFGNYTLTVPAASATLLTQ